MLGSREAAITQSRTCSNHSLPLMRGQERLQGWPHAHSACASRALKDMNCPQMGHLILQPCTDGLLPKQWDSIWHAGPLDWPQLNVSETILNGLCNVEVAIQEDQRHVESTCIPPCQPCTYICMTVKTSERMHAPTADIAHSKVCQRAKGKACLPAVA